MTARRMNGPPGRELVLAVDGGNAKTDLALLDSGGALLSFARGGGSSAHYLGVDGCIEALEGLLTDAIARAGLGPFDGPPASEAYLLLAGADLPEERSALQARIGELHWSRRLVVDNDTLALLRAGTDRGWGMAVVCGSGINCLGVAPDGRELRFLSFGSISGDWGGGSDIGIAALAAAVRSADGRGEPTVLEAAVPAHFGLADPVEVARAVHLRLLPEARLGELAAVVLAARDDDPVAAGIVARLTGEVISFARAVIRRLQMGGGDPDVVLGGRVLRAAGPDVLQAISRGIHQFAPSARILVAPSEPIVGAALLALEALGAEPGATTRARAELDAAVAAHERAAVTST